MGMKHLLIALLLFPLLTSGCVDDSATQLEGTDLSSVKDGTYVGECSAFPVFAKVEVTVRGHRITDLKVLEHRCGSGGPAEAITNDVLAKQSLNVDAISGATHSSKVILKAIENGLKKGVK